MRRTFTNSMRQLTIAHDFAPIEIPAVIYDLTAELLRDLFDQTMHYGFPSLFDSKPGKSLYLYIADKPVMVSALMDVDFLTLSVGSTRSNPFYLLTKRGFIFWQSDLKATDVAAAQKNLDKKMAKRGYYDLSDDIRVNVLAEGIFRVDEVFCKEFDYYVLSDELNRDTLVLFDDPRSLRILELHGRKVLCRGRDAAKVATIYRPVGETDIEKSKHRMKKGFRGQYDPKRYE